MFPDSLGGWRDPSNVRRAWRQVRDEAQMDGLVSHMLGKTVASFLALLTCVLLSSISVGQFRSVCCHVVITFSISPSHVDVARTRTPPSRRITRRPQSAAWARCRHTSARTLIGHRRCGQHEQRSHPSWQRDRLALLLDALDGVVISDGKRASLGVASRIRGAHRGEHCCGSHPRPPDRRVTPDAEI